MQGTKNNTFSNIATVIDKAIEMHKEQCDVNILVSPEKAEKIIEILETKYNFTYNLECAEMLQIDTEEAKENSVPIMIGIIDLIDNSEIITERLHKEYAPDAFMEGFYFIENKYNSCLLTINPYDYLLFDIEN